MTAVFYCYVLYTVYLYLKALSNSTDSLRFLMLIKESFPSLGLYGLYSVTAINDV